MLDPVIYFSVFFIICLIIGVLRKIGFIDREDDFGTIMLVACGLIWCFTIPVAIFGCIIIGVIKLGGYLGHKLFGDKE